MRDVSQAASLFADVSALAADECARLQVPAAAIGLRIDGADATAGFGAPAGARFRAASVTKLFTATLAMMLVEDGRLELDADVLDGITLRHLLTHTSGLEGELGGDLDRYGSDDAALERAIGDYGRLRRLAAPGERWEYCNTGFWLTGALIARAGGTTYEAAVRERLLTPLGLASSGLGGEIAEFPFPRCRVPSGGLVSTVADLLRFAAMHLGEGPELLAGATRRAMWQPFITGGDRPDDQQALGWIVREPEGERVVFHDGSYDGHESLLLLVPSHGVALAVLTHGERGYELWTILAGAVLGRLLGVPADEAFPKSLGVS